MPELLGLDLALAPDDWAAIGFALTGDVCIIDRVTVRLGRPGRKISGWAIAGIAEGDTIDGLPATTAPDPTVTAETPHPNGTTGIDHVVIVSPDPERTIAALHARGIEPRRQRHTEQYGPPFTQTFFRLGDPILELIGPDESSGDEPARFYGLAFTVRDLQVTARLLGTRLGRVKDAVQPGRRIATLRREAGLGLPIAFMSPGPSALDSP